jgi:rod shape determining protein RodA
MSFLEYNIKYTPTGWRKILYMNWPLVLVICAVACFGFVILFSVAGGTLDVWAEPQMWRFAMGFGIMMFVAFVPIWFWRNVSVLAYVVSILLLLYVEFFGITGGGARRWIDFGFVRLQPSELAKIAVVMMLATYYDWLEVRAVSRPVFVFIPLLIIALPVMLTAIQPDLGTSLLIMAGGVGIMFLAGVHVGYFLAALIPVCGAVWAVFASRGTEWALLADYQYNRIDVFFNPYLDPHGTGYNIIQSQIALGSGGWTGRGFMQGTQIRGEFIPEAHTDFIFAALAEEFGLIGGVALLALYILALIFCVMTALATRDRYASLVSLGVAITFFLYFAINMSMVMGLVPVVGVPLPLVSYGGSAMLVLMAAFGLVQSANIHRPR